MRRVNGRLKGWLAFSLITALHVTSTHAQTKAPAKRGGFSATFIGEGGSYQHPSGGAGDYMETSIRQEGGQGTFGPINTAPGSKPKPVERRTQTTEIAESPNSRREAVAPVSNTAPSSPESQAVAPAELPVASVAPDASHKGVGDRGEENRLPAGSKYSLWEGLAAPLELPSADADRYSGAQASEMVRKDYDSHILGRKSGSLEDAPAIAADATGLAASAAGRGEIFVSFELEVKSNPEQYRDALSGLKQNADFRLDPRFDAQLESSPGRTTVFGWMSPDKISAAMAVPSVSRVHVESAKAPRGGQAVSLTEILVGVRVPGSEQPAILAAAPAILSRVMGELSSNSGFQWKKTIGYQPIPGSHDTALILKGVVPVKNISLILAHRDVIKILPSPDNGGAVEGAAPARRSAAGFLAYAVSRAPTLVGVTLLLAVSSLGWGLFRLLRVLVPAR